VHLFREQRIDIMHRFIIGLVAAVALVACIDNPAEQTSGEDGHAFTVDGQSGLLVEGPGRAVKPLASYSESSVDAAGCWVVLEWCITPGTVDTFTCSFTPSCSIERAGDACESLVRMTCGVH
jgi:hypothetical protein